MYKDSQKLESRSGITSVVVPTRNRPAALFRCLTSLSSHLIQFGYSPRIMVADASTDEAFVQENDRIVSHMRDRHGWSVSLLGGSSRTNVVRWMIGQGVASDVARFALFGLPELCIPSPGANRNLLLLATAAERFLSLDDDTLCTFMSWTSLLKRLGITREPSESTISSFVERWSLNSEAISSALNTAEQTDIIRAHDSLLGKRAIDVLSVRSAHAPELGFEDGRKIALTLSGILGDCGWGTPSKYLFLDESSIKRIIGSDESYIRAITNREMLQASRSVWVTTAIDDLMTTAFAGDSRMGFPPFLPVARGEDLVLGSIYRLDGNFCYAFLPSCIAHVPDNRRPFRRAEVLRSAKSLDLSTLVTAIIQDFEITPRDCSTVSNQLGKFILDIAQLSDRHFVSYLRSRKRWIVKQKIRSLESTLFTVNALPKEFVSDVQKYIAALKTSVEDWNSVIPIEILFGRDLVCAILLTKQILRLFGELLRVWDGILDLASVSSPVTSSC
jgi:glycosyltransferase involved in cell wall biosynthesis